MILECILPLHLSSGLCADAHQYLNRKFPEEQKAIDNLLVTSSISSPLYSNDSKFLDPKSEVSGRGVTQPYMTSINNVDLADSHRDNNLLDSSTCHEHSKKSYVAFKNDEKPSDGLKSEQTVMDKSRSSHVHSRGVTQEPDKYNFSCASEEVQSMCLSAPSVGHTRKLSVPMNVKSNFSICPELISNTTPTEHMQQFRFQLGVTTSHIQATLQAMCGTGNTDTTNRFVLVII